MEKYISVLGVIIAVMLVLFFAVSKYVATNSATPPFGSCGQISDSARRIICLKELASKTLDISPCLEIEQTSDRDICMRNVAIKSRDSSICLQIATPGIKRICESELG